jgi:transposase-like protein
MDAIVPSCKGFRYPVEIISHCVWLYHRFPLGFREVEGRCQVNHDHNQHCYCKHKMPTVWRVCPPHHEFTLAK